MAKPPQFADLRFSAKYQSGWYLAHPTKEFWAYWQTSADVLRKAGFRVRRYGSERYGHWQVEFRNERTSQERVDEIIVGLRREKGHR